MRSHESDIDFVVLYVNGNDLEWQKKKAQYSPDFATDISPSRYRDWDIFKYWFRGVAKYAPWVRKIHLVTDNQAPEWLNADNPYLHLVNHSDYMPNDALPVFNSNAIEAGIHKIQGMSEKFVLFNDDTILTDDIEDTYYYRDELPVDMAGFTRPQGDRFENVFSRTIKNNYDVLNEYFDKREVVRKNFWKFYNLSYGKTFVRTLLNSDRDKFDGIVMPHLSTPYLKNDFQKVWDKKKDLLTNTQHHKFRSENDSTHLLFRWWRMCEGDFYPRRSLGKYFALTDNASVDKAVKAIEKNKYPEICLNDCWSDDRYEEAKEKIKSAFEKILPEKCEYEK